MFRLRRYILLTIDSQTVREVVKISGTRKPEFYESSEAEKRIRRAGLLHLFELK